MRPLRYIDAFAGIGGFGIATKRACVRLGIQGECVASVEMDAGCRKTYELNFGEPVTIGDIRLVQPSDFPDHDLLLAGFPCQPFSRNGKFYNKNDRTLGDDDRQNLVYYLIQLLAEKKPICFLFENVKELTTIKNKDGKTLFIDTLLENLAQIGYAVCSKVLDARDFGLPQQRKRVYFVGMLKDRVDSFFNEFKFPGGMRTTDVPAVEDILEAQVPTSYLLSNRWRNRNNVRIGGTRLGALQKAYDSGDWARPTSRTGRITPIAIVYGDTPSGLPRQQDKLYSVLGVSPTIATFSTPCFDTKQGWRQLTPRECARLQGLPDSFGLPENEHAAYKQIGNGIAIPVVEAIVYDAIRHFLPHWKEQRTEEVCKC